MTTAQKPTQMSTHRFIEDMEPGERIEDDVFMIAQKDLRTTSNGSLYIHLVLADRTGQCVARVWQATQAQFEAIPAGGFVRLKGRVESYKGNLQFIVDATKAADPADLNVADFLPTTKQDIDALWERVVEILRTIKHPALLALMREFVQDEELAARFKRAPAAIHNHHAYIGGLLEHTCNVLELAARVFGATDDAESLYPTVSRDLVLAGVFLHDIGKTAELEYETNLVYSTEGQLVGHITQAAIWIDRKATAAEAAMGEPFPADVRNLLTHIVLSHHGVYEFGSPKLPSCPEAIVVHYLDNIDAKLFMALNAIDGAKDPESDFTSFCRPLDTRVFKKDIMGLRGDA